MNQPVVLELPGTADVAVRADLPYRDGRTLDVYLPAGPPAPTVVLVSGYADRMFASVIDGKPKHTVPGTSWARLLAASGLAAIRYEVDDPAADVAAVIAHVRERGAELGVAGDRVAVFACSGNAPTGLAAAATSPVRCAVFAYGFLAGDETAAAAARFHFANPGTTIDALPTALPVLVVRAGQDQFEGVIASIDRFVAAALARNLPLELLNLPDAPHAFDLVDPSERSRAAIRRIIAFLREHLG